MVKAVIRVTANLDDATLTLLKRIADQEWRSQSSTLVLLIRQEAQRRGMLAKAPSIVPAPPRQQSDG